MEREHKNTNIIPMLDRGLRIIEIIRNNRAPMGVSELSEETGLSKATIYRLLYTLEQNGYVEQDQVSEKYGLGMAFIKIGEYVKSTVDITSIAKPYMDKLAGLTGETTYLCRTYYDEALILETISGEASALYSMVTPTIPLYCSALGRVLLAGFSQDQLNQYMDSQEFAQRTINTRTTQQEIEQEIKAVNEKGVSVEIEEYEYGMTCIAGPIYDQTGEIIASLSVSGPATRIDYKGRERIIENVQRICSEVSKKLSL